MNFITLRLFRFICISVILFGIPASGFSGDSPKKLRIGVTLHPYYSFVKNTVGDRAEVVPLIDPGFNPHNYRPQPSDIKKLADPETALDVLVVNGIGHDEFAFQILKAAGLEGKLPLIYANKGVALIPVGGTGSSEKIVNPHTFIGINASIQQIYNIANELGKLDPDNAAYYRKNSRSYCRRLRKLKAEYMKRLGGLKHIDFRCATLHGGYDYLLQEFGLQVVAVIEPKHGVKPSAIELADTIQRIKKANIGVVFTEMDFPDKVVDTIHKETGIKIRFLSHLTAGTYGADSFEKGMELNLKNLTDALIAAAEGLN